MGSDRLGDAGWGALVPRLFTLPVAGVKNIVSRRQSGRATTCVNIAGSTCPFSRLQVFTASGGTCQPIAVPAFKPPLLCVGGCTRRRHITMCSTLAAIGKKSCALDILFVKYDQSRPNVHTSLQHDILLRFLEQLPVVPFTEQLSVFPIIGL